MANYLSDAEFVEIMLPLVIAVLLVGVLVEFFSEPETEADKLKKRRDEMLDQLRIMKKQYASPSEIRSLQFRIDELNAKIAEETAREHCA